MNSEENYILHVIQYERYQISSKQKHTDQIAKVIRIELCTYFYKSVSLKGFILYTYDTYTL